MGLYAVLPWIVDALVLTKRVMVLGLGCRCSHAARLSTTSSGCELFFPPTVISLTEVQRLQERIK